MLSAQQLEQYHCDGFLLLPALVPQALLAELNQRFFGYRQSGIPLQWGDESDARCHGR